MGATTVHTYVVSCLTFPTYFIYFQNFPKKDLPDQPELFGAISNVLSKSISVWHVHKRSLLSKRAGFCCSRLAPPHPPAGSAPRARF